MKALIKERPAAGLTLAERPEPEPQPGEAKVRMLRTGFRGIVPVMIPDAEEAVAMAARLGEAGVYVRAFAYPVVPMGKARLRVQLSAARTREDMDAAAAGFIAARAGLAG